MSASDTAAAAARDVRPPAFRGHPYAGIAGFVAAAAAYQQLVVEGVSGQNLLNLWLYYSLVVVGFYFVFAVAGEFAFSQAAFVGVGAYTSAWVARSHDPWLGVLAAVTAGAVIAAAFALLLRRAGHFYFAIATLALGEIALLVYRRWDSFTGGLGGELVGVPPLSFFGNAIDTHERAFWMLLGALVLALALGTMLHRSPVAREAVAHRDNPAVAATLGLPVLRIKVVMFALGSAAASFAGALFVHWNGFATPDSFSVELALATFLMLILGGMGSIWGPLVGAWFYVFVPDKLQQLDVEIFGKAVGDYREILYGVLLIVVMIVFPEGLVGLFQRTARLAARRARGRR